jgi:hypothetical protein
MERHASLLQTTDSCRRLLGFHLQLDIQRPPKGRCEAETGVRGDPFGAEGPAAALIGCGCKLDARSLPQGAALCAPHPSLSRSLAALQRCFWVLPTPLLPTAWGLVCVCAMQILITSAVATDEHGG